MLCSCCWLYGDNTTSPSSFAPQIRRDPRRHPSVRHLFHIQFPRGEPGDAVQLRDCGNVVNFRAERRRNSCLKGTWLTCWKWVLWGCSAWAFDWERMAGQGIFLCCFLCVEECNSVLHGLTLQPRGIWGRRECWNGYEAFWPKGT